MTRILHKHPLSHRDAARLHTWRRAWERFGLALSLADVLELERRIVAGKGRWVQDQQEMRTVYRMQFRGRDLLAVFDVRLWCLVTVMPRGYRVA